MRLGISYVRGIGLDLAQAIAAGRPYTGPEDLARRVPLTLPQLEALATAGAFDCFGMPVLGGKREAKPAPYRNAAAAELDCPAQPGLGLSVVSRLQLSGTQLLHGLEIVWIALERAAQQFARARAISLPAPRERREVQRARMARSTFENLPA